MINEEMMQKFEEFLDSRQVEVSKQPKTMKRCAIELIVDKLLKVDENDISYKSLDDILDRLNISSDDLENKLKEENWE